ncbi:hypothetical protein [Algoriphagus limi]|uniref:Uncharacterized protein n=1 Tax=Algoriphagus limi TaxID=2975273 RepID=A0ABT2GB18_9BACT|nr:hypothetical protein [Algoriphagus limi]MCS5491200.1 hypothetical protein [Algoriphagus limi]
MGLRLKIRYNSNVNTKVTYYVLGKEFNNIDRIVKKLDSSLFHFLGVFPNIQSLSNVLTNERTKPNLVFVGFNEIDGDSLKIINGVSRRNGFIIIFYYTDEADFPRGVNFEYHLIKI